MKLTRGEYAARYGPTAGDRIRLGDTGLWIRVESDHAAPGDEPMWGYGKNLRSRMSQFDAATTESELDMVILGVVVIDPLLGVVKADLGIKEWADRGRWARREP
jgi:urease subunit alpha